MKTLRILLGAVALALMSTVAQAQTPVPQASATQGVFTPAPSPSPIFNRKPGTTVSSLFSNMAIGSCVVNPPSIPLSSATLHSCTVTGAETGDKVFVNMRPVNADQTTPYATDYCYSIQGAQVTAANTVTFRFVNHRNSLACDPPATTVDYWVVRENRANQ